MLYKVVIVDESLSTAEQTAKSIPWEKCKCKVVATVTEKEKILAIENALEVMLESLQKKSGIEVENSFIVKNAVKYIEEHYSEKLTLLETANHMYISHWHLSKLLKKHTGYGFSEILNMVRIDHAKELLKDKSLRVSDVAEQVGFVNASHFSRVFKKRVGLSANEYRNQIES